jgi:hypothetical protein
VALFGGVEEGECVALRPLRLSKRQSEPRSNEPKIWQAPARVPPVPGDGLTWRAADVSPHCSTILPIQNDVLGPLIKRSAAIALQGIFTGSPTLRIQSFCLGRAEVIERDR